MRDSGVPGAGRRCLLAGLLATGSLLALAGCASSGSAGGAESTASPIPPVDKPRDITAFTEHPCQLLSPQQAAQYGIDRPGRQIQGTLGNSDCEWRSSRLDVWIYISTYRSRDTLEDTYAKRQALPYFEITRLGGYPAIVSKTEATLPVCDIDIRTAAAQSLTVTYDSTNLNARPDQGCVVDRRVAMTVLGNLPSPA